MNQLEEQKKAELEAVDVTDYSNFTYKEKTDYSKICAILLFIIMILLLINMFAPYLIFKMILNNIL